MDSREFPGQAEVDIFFICPLEIQSCEIKSISSLCNASHFTGEDCILKPS